MPTKFTDLTEDTAPTSTDIVAVSDDIGGTPTSKKVALSNFLKGVDVSALTATTVATGDLVMVADIDASNGARKVTAQSIADLSTSGIGWEEETTTSHTFAEDQGIIANNASQVTVTLPDTAAVGATVRIVGKGAGGWKIAQNSGETIYWNESASTTTGTGGSLESTDDYDAVELLCITANTDWVVLSSKGNITVN